jgi:hypothetical protein
MNEDDIDPDFSESSYYDLIKFGISQDNLVHYEQDSDVGPYEHNSILRFNKSVKNIWVPKNVGIEVSSSDRDIEGIIASPALILDHSGELELSVQNKKSRLRLCIETDGLVRLNREVKFEGLKNGNNNGYRQGQNFKYYKTEYLKYLNTTTLDPEIITNEKGINADFEYSRFSHYDISVCMHFGLVYLQKTDGDINLFFENLKESHGNKNKGNMKSKCIDITDKIIGLRKKMKEAIDKEEYEKAKKFKDEINKIAENIGDSDNPQQSL